MAKTCAQCHTIVPGPSRFCPRCGSRVGTSATTAVMGVIILAIVIVLGLFFVVG